MADQAEINKEISANEVSGITLRLIDAIKERDEIQMKYDAIMSVRDAVVDNLRSQIADANARAEAAEAERDRLCDDNEALRILIESQGRDHAHPCNLGVLCPWCHAESLQAALAAKTAVIAKVEVRAALDSDITVLADEDTTVRSVGVTTIHAAVEVPVDIEVGRRVRVLVLDREGIEWKR